ncbi:SprT family zinc-dependent metalloprotease [Methanolapillus ohkumae]|uniref:YgjP-like metallopeptidase domain-containing protein n=1 Tax=Methanolapillus ohkumae TaxID=3028298 RepID=A0AA96V7H7_9EURY|nr:hypothetical protein MsAm2_08300 [Methanosarcinaceae archaeon Am2]
MTSIRPGIGEKTHNIIFKTDSLYLPCTVIYSPKRKKTIGYTVRFEENEAVLFVRAPAGLSSKDILSVLFDNEKNVAELLEKAEMKQNVLVRELKKSYKNGSLFHYMGREYTLCVFFVEREDNRSNKIEIRLLEGQIRAYLPAKMLHLTQEECEQKIKKAVDGFYREQADVFFKARVDFFADKYLPLLLKKPSSVEAANYTGKWGCCTAQNEIKLNWALIQADTPIIDYIIIHELAHIRHKNHSAHFWNLVEQMDPNFKEKRNWLKENGWILGFK